MPAKVELMVQLYVNGRPIWRKARVVKTELTYRMDDKEYGEVVDAAARELAEQVRVRRTWDEKKTGAVMGKVSA